LGAGDSLSFFVEATSFCGFSFSEDSSAVDSASPSVSSFEVGFSATVFSS
jgi:hypothetical protein